MKTLLYSIYICLVIVACSNSNARFKSDTLQEKISSHLVDSSTSNRYYWKIKTDFNNALINRITLPEGYTRVDVKQNSFGDWLLHLPLKPGNPEVHLFDGSLKKYQGGHYAVVDIDVGNSDLQQCADAVMRMRAEYLYSIHDYEKLHFNFTSGDKIEYLKWMKGYRTVIKGNKVTWVKSAAEKDDYPTFKEYMNTIFNYSGTSSLSKELMPVRDLKSIQAGDVFIVGGFPGHAVLVVDVCENIKTKEKLFVIQQSYMPAQDIHILKNLNNTLINPWYSINFGDELITPEWTFSKSQLMRFKN